MNEATTSASDYRILRVIGRGGMGVVYEAEHGSLGRRVALKVLAEDALEDPTALARLRREALAMGALQHPHVVQVSAFSEGPPPFLVMELLAGQPLRARLAERGPMRPADACLVAVQLLSALGAAHRAGIVHRDVKPANVLVVDTPLSDVFVKLLDFGVAKLLRPAGTALTSTDVVVGSAPYMAPEQICGESVDARTDVFALGITLYEMLAGRRPFAASEGESVLFAIVRGAPIAPLQGMPRGLEAVVLRALSREPSARFPSAEAMAAALAPFVGRGAPAPLQTDRHAPDAGGAESVAGAVATATSRRPTPTATLPFTTQAPPLPQPGLPVPAVNGPGRPPAKWRAWRGPVVVALGVAALLVAGRIGSALSVGNPFARGGTPLGSCRREDQHVCAEHVATSLPDEERRILRAMCVDPTLLGAWSDAPCDHAGAAFGCRMDKVTLWYYEPAVSRTLGPNYCPATRGGVLLAP